MRSLFLYLLLLCVLIAPARAQLPEESWFDQQLEDLSESAEEESEDEFDLQQLLHFRRHPLNLNDPDADLSSFPFLNPALANNLSQYRKLLGNFLSVHELQAVPGFSVDLIRRLMPYVRVSDPESEFPAFLKRFSSGEYSIVGRPTLPSKTYFRWKYQFRNLLQYGFLAERDAGERSLLDFYSFHFFARRLGIIKSLAVGDYSLNLGQGLIHWQSQAFRKTAQVLNVKRQAETVRPYFSAGEYNFQRGAAVVLKHGAIEQTLFFSRRNLSATLAADADRGEVITSFNTMGLYLTELQRSRKNNVSLTSFGGSTKVRHAHGHFAANLAHYRYSVPVLRRDEPYNLFAFRGQRLLNGSVDFDYTVRNIHAFGEFAMSHNMGKAAVLAVLFSLGARADITLLHRHIGRSYQSIYGNAFTENTLPVNENGNYFGISLRPSVKWQVDAYSDIFNFPWLKYRVDAPTHGSHVLLQVTWKPARNTEVYSRVRSRLRSLNEMTTHLRFPGERQALNWRTNISFAVNRRLTLKSRIELTRFEGGTGPGQQNGFLMFMDIHYRPAWQGITIQARTQAFETDSYDTRIYAFESDVLYASSTPAFFGSGYRSYLTARKKIMVQPKWKLVADVGLKISLTTLQEDENQPRKNIFQIRLQAVFSKAG